MGLVLAKFYCILYAVIYALMTVFAAKTINCLYNGDYEGAFIWLAIELADIILRSFASLLQYICYAKHYGIIRKNITKKVCDKIFKLDDNIIKNFSAEKIINIAQNNMSSAAGMPDTIAVILQYSVQTLVAIFSIFLINIYAGIIVVAVGVMNFFVYGKLNKKLGIIMNRRYEAKDKSFKEYSKIISGKQVIHELNSKENYSEKLLGYVDEFNKEYLKYYKVYSFRDDVYYAIWNIVIYAITALLIFFVFNGTLDLSVYLIIVPYLISGITSLNSLYENFGEFENARVDVDRLNLFLSLDDKQVIQYGNVNDMCSGYNLGFIDVSYKNPVYEDVNLKNVDISFKMNALNIIKGERGCGKRCIFDILRRKIKPDDGIVLLDNLNLFDYNDKTFKNHIDYCAAHPMFVEGTVKENLLLANDDFEFIKSLVKEFELEEKINELENGYDTDISTLNGETKFWIGLIRAALKKCKILMIYEYPENVSSNFHIILKNIIAKSEADKRTLILFTNNVYYDDIADIIYEIKDGKVNSVDVK